MTRVTVALALLIVALVLTSCEYTDPFSDYRGVNLITDRGLSVDDFAEAYADGSDPAVGYDYITIGTPLPAEYGSTSGLPAGAETSIRRIEIPNLLADGDFEDPGNTVGAAPGAWDTTLSPPLVFQVEDAALPNPDIIIGQSVYFEMAGGELGAYDLATLLDGFVAGSSYYYELDARRGSTVTELTAEYSYLTPSPPISLRQWSSPALMGQATTPVEHIPDPEQSNLAFGTIFASPETGPVPASSYYFTMGSVLTTPFQIGYLDNVRIGRVDNGPLLEITLAVEATDALPIVAGDYEFSVYVKAEIDAQVTPSAPDGLNAYRAGQVLLGKDLVFTRFEAGDVGWTTSGWEQVAATVAVSAADVASGQISLQITPSSATHPAVGRILIASPSLELIGN